MENTLLTDDVAGLRRVLQAGRVIAVVGLSADSNRPSHLVAKYLLERGYRIIPVNPRESEILGQKCYARLTDIPEPVDIVDCFRRAQDIGPIAEDAIAIRAKTLWLQLDIRNETAEQRALAAGLDVVVDRCVKIEYARLFGDVPWPGGNSGSIACTRPPSPLVV